MRIISPKVAYLVGIIGGDGTISEIEKRITITDKSLEFHERILKPLLKELFNKEPVISKMRTKNNKITFRTRIISNEAIKLLKMLGIPTKNKTYMMKTPREISDSTNVEVIKNYIKGWMDAEGWVTLRKIKRKRKTYFSPKIGFQTVNKTIRDELVSLIIKFGIRPSVWNSNKMFGFEITGHKKFEKFLIEIGFNHPEKIRKCILLRQLRAKRGLQCAGQRVATP